MRTVFALAAFALASCTGGSDGTPHAVTFELVNTGPCAAFIQVSGGRHLALTRDGLGQQIEHDCGVCSCEMCPNCAVCGMEFATVARIAPGATRTDTWDGRVWRPGSGSCALGCESPAAASPGSYVVEVGFGHASQDSGAGAMVSGLVTTTRTFRHADEPTVEIALDTAAFRGLAGSDCP